MCYQSYDCYYIKHISQNAAKCIYLKAENEQEIKRASNKSTKTKKAFKIKI